MDINDLTIGQAKEISSMFGLANINSPVQKCGLNTFAVGKNVILRTYSAGVFVGILRERSGKEAILENSRRIWSWSGAFTLSKVANDGVVSAKMSTVEPEKLVTECIEVIPCSNKAFTQLMGIKTHEQ